MIYLQLFWEFFKTGLFSVGGGLATLPFLSRMSNRFGWFTQEDLGNMLAVSESTPGPIGVNMATYVGNLTGGIVGGLVTTMALILPSYLVILMIATVMEMTTQTVATRRLRGSFFSSSMAIKRTRI